MIKLTPKRLKFVESATEKFGDGGLFLVDHKLMSLFSLRAFQIHLGLKDLSIE